MNEHIVWENLPVERRNALVARILGWEPSTREDTVVEVSHTGTTAIAGTLRVGGTAATVAGLLLLVAAMGKAAQVPFQGWLQDAMLGPTPVSALLHAATLVIAGVVLLMRALPLFPPGVLLLVGLAGGVTALVAGLMAIA